MYENVKDFLVALASILVGVRSSIEIPKLLRDDKRDRKKKKKRQRRERGRRAKK